MAFVSYGRPYDDALLLGKGASLCPSSFGSAAAGTAGRRTAPLTALPALGGEGQYIQAGDLAGSIQGTSKEGL